MQEDSNKKKNKKSEEEPKKESNEYLRELTQEKYKYGFTTDIHTDIIEKGLNEEVIRLISAKKNEPEWLLEFRLKAYRHWLTMEMPTWAHLDIPKIDYHPIVSGFERILGTKSILIGFGLSEDAIHSPNESFGLAQFDKGLHTIPLFYKHFAK